MSQTEECEVDVGNVCTAEVVTAEVVIEGNMESESKQKTTKTLIPAPPMGKYEALIKVFYFFETSVELIEFDRNLLGIRKLSQKKLFMARKFFLKQHFGKCISFVFSYKDLHKPLVDVGYQNSAQASEMNLNEEEKNLDCDKVIENEMFFEHVVTDDDSMMGLMLRYGVKVSFC